MQTWTVKKQGWLKDIPFTADVVAVVVADDATKLGRQVIDNLLHRHFDQDWGEVSEDQTLWNLVKLDHASRGIGFGYKTPQTVRGVYRTLCGASFEVVTDIFLARSDVRILPV